MQRAAFEKLHHEERAPVSHRVVVENADGAGVVDTVRDVALSEEARSHVRVLRERHGQDFHRATKAVAMRRREDRGHTSDSDERVQSPLVAKGRTYAGLGFSPNEV